MQRQPAYPLSPARRGDAQPDSAAQRSRSMSQPAAASMPGCMQTSAPLHGALALTGGRSVAHITLNDQLYVLRITRAGKLILTK